MVATHKISGRTVFITATVETESGTVAKCFVDGARPTAFPLTDLEVHADASLLAWVQSPEWAYGISFERWQALEAYATKNLKETL